MTYNLFDLTYRVARELGILYAGSATGGSATTIGDLTLARFDNDYFNKVDKGTAWIVQDAGGAGAAPQGEYGRITDFVSAGGVVTIETLSTAVAAGDKYVLADDKINLDAIIGSINSTIEMYTIPVTNSTKIIIADNQTEYTLPDMAGGKLLNCYYQGDTTDSNDNRWIKMPQSMYRIQYADVGTADTIRFTYQLSSTHAVMLEYEAPHSAMLNSTNQLSEHIPLPLVVYPAALDLAWYFKDDWDTDKKDSRIAKLEQKAARAQAMYKVDKPKRSNRAWAIKRGTYTPDSTVGTVYLK